MAEREGAPAAVAVHRASTAIFSKLYIGSVPFDVSPDDLRAIFSQFGPVDDVSMIMEPVQARHRGYGFVEFDCPEGATLALAAMDGVLVGDRRIKVGRPNNYPSDLPPGVPPPLQSRIYVANIHGAVTEDQFGALVGAIGPTARCQLIAAAVQGEHDGTPRQTHRGCGYVEYCSAASASLAVELLHDFCLVDRPLKVCRTVFGGPFPRLSDAPEGGGGPAGREAQPLAPAAAGSIPPPRTVSNLPQHQVPTAVWRAAQEISAGLSVAAREGTVIVLANMEDYAALAGEPGRGEGVTPPLHDVVGGGAEDHFCGASKALCEEVREECMRFGPVEECTLHVSPASLAVYIFVSFADRAAAEAALAAMHNRWFGGRRIAAAPFPFDRYVRRDFASLA